MKEEKRKREEGNGVGGRRKEEGGRGKKDGERRGVSQICMVSLC